MLLIFIFTLSFNLMSLEMTIITPTGNQEVVVDLKKIENAYYLNLSKLFSAIGIFPTISEDRIKFIQGDIRVEMDLNSPNLTITRDNITRLLKLSYPLRIDEEAVWIELSDLTYLFKESMNYQIQLGESLSLSNAQVREFEEIYVPPSVGDKEKLVDSKQTTQVAPERHKCWKRILIVPGHIFFGEGIKLFEKFEERDINQRLSKEIINIIKANGFEALIPNEISEKKLDNLKEYLGREQPDLILSVHVGYPSSDPALINVFYSKFGDYNRDQQIIELIDIFLENSHKLSDVPVPRIYSSSLALSSLLNTPEILIEFIPQKKGSENNLNIEEVITYKPYIEQLVNSLKQYSNEKCK